MTHEKDFKGYIHDVGGPTANFRQPACKKQLTKGACPNRQCLFPEPCKNMIADHSDYVALLRKLRKLLGVKKVFIRSGIRFDYLLADRSETFFRELVRYHISGQLKVAPEHVSDHVLEKMGKPCHAVYLRFLEKYKKINDKCRFWFDAIGYKLEKELGYTKEQIEAGEEKADAEMRPQED